MSRTKQAQTRAQLNKPMATYTCRHCGGLLLSEKLDSCGCSAAATEELIARRSAAACSPVGVEARVAADIAARQRVGILKYGTTVADNPLPLREWLEHAYQEALDLPIYLKRAIEEIDRENA